MTDNLASKRWNILWISLEDFSPRMGCYGDAVASTPNLDSFAKQGRRYTHAFSTAPVCAPARCAIITGMYAAAIGAHHMRVTHSTPASFGRLPSYECVPPPHVKLLPEYLRGAGYFCSNNEKTDYQFTPPFTAWDELGKEAHWRGRSPGQPFFSVFNSICTHESAMWGKDGGEPETDPAKVEVPPYLPDTPETRKTIARHYDNVRRIDRWVGTLLSQLEEEGLADDTLVFVWSDHGEGLPRHKRWLYDTGLRVPLLVRWPGVIGKGEVSDRLVSSIDFAPAVLRAAGITVPVHLQGVDFLSNSSEPRSFAFATRDRYDEFYDCQRAVRDTQYKYIRNYCPEVSESLWNDYLNKHPITRELWRGHLSGTLTAPASFFFRYPRPPEELYDTDSDPWELNNLAEAPEYLAKLHAMREVLDTWQRNIGDHFRESEEQMALRFWPNHEQPMTKAPVVVAYDGEKCGHLVEKALHVASPALIQLHPPTQGSSIGFRFEVDQENRWRLYTGPIRLETGDYNFEAKAIRVGYKESPCVRFRVTVGD